MIYWKLFGRSTIMNRSNEVNYQSLKLYTQLFLYFTLICAAQISFSHTNPSDVAAINNLYASLGSPVIPGWVASAGDPCAEAWQGVQCVDFNISTITLNAANLGGELGENLGLFTALAGIDLSNNHIGGSIPSNLPVTLRTFFLSSNQFNGSIPDSLSTLTQLSAVSLNNNLLTGEIPDAFGTLAGLVNLDISSNNLSGQLPPSLGSLPSLTTLHLQNNHLSGTLDVLQDIPLQDLNVEHNLFAGPIPGKLLSIPTFKKDGNLFNTTIAPVPSPTSPTEKRPPASPPVVPYAKSPPSPGKRPPGRTAGKQDEGPSVQDESNSGKSKKDTSRIVWIVIAAVLSFIVLVLGLTFCITKCTRRRVEVDRIHNRHEIGAHKGGREASRDTGPSALPATQMGKGAREAVIRPKENDQMETRKIGARLKLQNDQEINSQRKLIPRRDDHEIDMSALDMMLMHPPPPPPPPRPPPPFPPVGKANIEPVPQVEVRKPKPSTRTLEPSVSARYFTIASLQQYTNSFSPENLIGEGMLGKVYRAELPDGKLLAVKKLEKAASSQLQDIEFLELVDAIDKIRHANVVELMGYSAEHGERLLVYEYCNHGSLQDALHADDDLKKQLSWNSRVRMALGAARALEYLHEVYHPPIIHRNFKAANVLLDDDLSVRVSDCGLAPLITLRSVGQLSGHLLTAYGYGAPEFELGIYTIKSDVYSFGVVMLELLTGRKSYDRTRNHGEQFLVRWAIPQLHDIDALSEMVDPYLNGEYPAKSLSNFADIISRCVQPEPEFRPQMSEVVQDLLEMIRREPRSTM